MSTSSTLPTPSPNAKYITNPSDFKNNHIISVKQFNRQSVEYVQKSVEKKKRK